MRHPGGDGNPGDAWTPGGEPEPAELWITGGPGDASGGTGHGGRAGGSGGPGRTRWIALAAGFVVLVAVIAVQHFAGGRPSASPDATGSASAPPTPSPSDSPVTTDRSTASVSNQTPPSTPHPDSSGGTMLPSTSQLAHRGPPTVPPPPSPTTTVDTTSPSTGTAPKGLLPGAGDWELVGYGVDGVVRYRPATGRLVVTPVPPLLGNDGTVLFFVVTGSTAIIRPLAAVPGYVVADGKPADGLTGALATGQAVVLPGPDPTHLWASLGGSGSVALLDARGKRTGTTMKLPGAAAHGGYSLTSDGDGYVLAVGVGGVYDVRPDGASLVTHGRVLAAGPTRFLVYECDTSARCGTAVVDRTTGRRRAIPAYAPSEVYVTQGVVAPDGRYAALIDQGRRGSWVTLIDLRARTVDTPLMLSSFNAGNDLSTLLVFTPDGRYLLVDTGSEVVPIDLRSGKVLGQLPLPPMGVIAVRPGR